LATLMPPLSSPLMFLPFFIIQMGSPG
jgi:hypothetical protein